MRLLIHDLSEEQINVVLPERKDVMKIVSDDGSTHQCNGCFGCWVKTPGVCGIKDKYQNMGELFSESEEIIIISKWFYGGFSPFVKNIMDRSISYVLPYFVKRNGEMHHKQRYDHKIEMKVWFYGDHITDEERLTADTLLQANAINLACNGSEVNYVQSITEIKLI